MTYNRGDRVVITNPQQPTGHQIGDTAEVIHTQDTPHGQMLKLIHDDGRVVTVWATEISKAADR
ncbi:hypothetical protein P3T35_003048 [Kitasatospora sp. GP30]|uniref:hypothetical protein n=1 Tax=Kitasatospora sp. GP30 TaxID=3035084 RepID=UPI000C70DE43|nr:hypothetical protein [Kitasatospora sp. GP30]MDH6141035.1 hypothetical protein [Kitasatospora sp. GP30]